MSSTDIDVERVRADVRGIDRITHLNSCGSSIPPDAVVDAQIAYLLAEQAMGGYEAAEAHGDALADFSSATAELLGCGEDEVSFQSGASEAWWRAFTAVPLEPGDRVLAGTSEFQASAFGLLQARGRGVIVEVIPNDPTGTIDLEALRAAIDGRVRLVCLTQISMSNGAVHPAADVGRICRDAGVTFLLDACQVAGQRPLDVDELGCDFLVYTGRKFMRGPRGTGVLYARRSTVDRLGPTPFVDGASARWVDESSWRHVPGAARFELGERNYAGQIGLATATRYALDVGLEAIRDRVTDLAGRLRRSLAGLDGVTVLDEGLDRSAIVTFDVAGSAPDDVAFELGTRGINVGAPGRHNAQWDIGRRGHEAVVRVGVHYFNTDDEVDRLLTAVAEIAGRRLSAADRSRSEGGPRRGEPPR